MSSKYSHFTLPELRKELKKRNAKVSGRKRELIERLEFYDRNSNFGQAEVTQNDYQMPTPDATSYKDINTDSPIPDVNRDKLKAFLELFDQDLGDKAENLYHGRFLHTVRYSADGDSTFVVGRVSAEMKKKVVYKVDVKLDSHGVPEETQCECAVGMGPTAHCKHVCLVIFALTKVREGITTKETCTQVLQTFHQTKKYSGSPVKMQDLQLRRSGSLSALKEYSARPVHRQGTLEYPGQFRSVWVNSRAEKVSIRQLYAPANIYAICHDHDYLQKTPEELFLDEIGVTQITDSERAKVEKETQGQSGNKKWKEERTKRLQASNFGRICKAGDRADKEKMASSFTKIADFRSKPTDHGRKYEPAALESYSKKTSLKVKKNCGIFVCREHPFLGCSPDGLVENHKLVEVKCPYVAKDMIISPATVPYLCINEQGDLALDSTHEYFFQVQGSMLCTETQTCDFVVWTHKDMVIVSIDRDDHFISDMFLQLRNFFDSFFKKAVLEKFLYLSTDKYAFTY